MTPPYRRIMSQFHDHWLIGHCVNGPEIDWEAILTTPRWSSLSAGESRLILIALALYNGDQTARVSDILRLDVENRHLVLAALEDWCQRAPA